MPDINQILEAFTQGRVDFAGLLQAVDGIASDDPSRIPELSGKIDELYRQGRLPPQLHNTLQFHLRGIQTANTGETPEQEDRTRITSRPGAAPQTPPGEDDSTRISTSAPAAGTSDEDRTRITSRTPTSTTGTSGFRTGATSPPSTATGGTGTGTGTYTATRNISNEPIVGDVLKDRFVLEAEIGRGGMGVVFKALDKRKIEARDRHPYVALKLLNESFKQHEESLMALQREARKAQDLKHPNVIGIFDFDKDEHDNYFIAMEFLEGEPLDKFLKQQRGTGIPPRKAIELINKMGLALAAGHNHRPGIVHSDFKPGNVFLTNEGDIKVFDFGIARAAKPKGMDAKGDVTVFDAGTLGALTPTYASLEMLEGGEPDPRDDIYALAIVAYELLAGNRPFGRTPANKALGEGMSPARIKGLSSRQWRGLERGLAFKRENRTSTVEEFLDDLRFRKSQLPLILGLSAAGVGILSWILVPQYLEKKKEAELTTAIEQASPAQIPAILESGAELNEESRNNLANKAMGQLLNTLASGSAEQILATIESLQKLPEEFRQDILTEGKESILAYYQGQADSAFAPQEKRYNYGAAVAFLEQASKLYPDSVQVFKTTQRMEEARNDLLNELDGKFSEHLQAGRLLPDPEADDIADVLLILSQLDPEHSLLTDQRLAVAYTQQATTTLERGEFQQASLYAEAGLALFPGDIALSNIQARIQIAQKESQAKALLASLQEELQKGITEAKTLDDYRNLDQSLARLRSINPTDPLLIQAEQGLQSLFDIQLASLMAEQQWSQGAQLLEEFGDQLSTQYFDTQANKLREAQGAYELRINELFNGLSLAIAEHRLTPPADENAMDILAKARELVPDDPRIEQGRANIGRAYLDLARESRAKGEWEQARTYVNQGLALEVSGQINDALSAELPEISRAEEQSRQLMAEAERKKLEQERQQKIEAFYTRFDENLANMKLTVEDGRRMLADLDKLAALNPTDPLLGSGRSRIADRFAEEGVKLAGSDDWNKAISLVQDGMSVIPESPKLAVQLEELRRGFETQKAEELSKEIDSRKASINDLIAQVKYTNGWVNQLTTAFKSLEALLSPDDPWVMDARERTGRLYLDQALKERSSKQFAKAGALLRQGESFAPGLMETFDAERIALKADEEAWEKENQERAHLASLEGAKQSLLTQAKANDTTKALKTLEELRGQLAVEDPFLTTTGPEAIGSAYLRLAERRAKRNDFNGAIKLVQNGLDVAPGMSELNEKLTFYRQEADIAVERNAFSKTPVAKLNSLKERLQALEQKHPERYPKAVDEFADILAKRIRDIRDAKAAQKFLDAALALLPGNGKLEDIVIEQPPEPSIIAAKGLKETRSGQLSSAGKLLDEARRKEADHPDTKRLDEELGKKLSQAESSYREYQQALKAKEHTKAKTHLEQALAIWNDNANYKKELDSLAKAAAKPSTTAAVSGKETCNPQFAGHGKRSSKFRCSDVIEGDNNGPIMVVVPPGGGHSGPYAIGRYEISVGDYNLYCKLSGACSPVSGKDRKLPITGISLNQANAYAAWLSGKTGATYRLPNESEWKHAATSSGKQFTGTDFNCKLVSGGSIVKGGAPVSVNVAPQNAWGLFNYVGNAQEWVITGSGTQAIGGHYDDSASDCSIALIRNHTGDADSVTGFRLLREIRL